MGWTDLATRVQTAGQAVFGETVTFTPAGGSPEAVTGIFDADHVYQELLGDTMIETTRPVMVVRDAALSQTPVRGDAISVRSVSYVVTEIQPDGQGDQVLILEVV